MSKSDKSARTKDIFKLFFFFLMMMILEDLNQIIYIKELCEKIW